MGLKAAVIVGCLSALFYYVYVPIMPDITTEPVKMSCLLTLKQLIDIPGSVGSYLGLGAKHNISRTISHYITPSSYSTESVKVTEIYFNGVRTLVYKPRKLRATELPAMIYIHGGGFVYSHPEDYHLLTMHIASTMNIVVVSIDYRLAPEFPYPIPFNDCLKATTGFLETAAKYGVDPNRVAIAGDSAGGNLATTVSLKLHSDKNAPKLKLQILLYPTTQAMDFNTPSFKANEHDYILSKNSGIMYAILHLMGLKGLPNLEQLIKEARQNKHYDTSKLEKIASRVDTSILLPESETKGHIPVKPTGAGHPDLSAFFTAALQDPYFSPLTGASDAQLRALPPAYVVTCKRDILRDEGLMYMARIEKAGGRILVHKEYDFSHGMFSFFPFNLTESRMAVKDLTDYFLKNAVL